MGRAAGVRPGVGPGRAESFHKEEWECGAGGPGPRGQEGGTRLGGLRHAGSRMDRRVDRQDGRAGGRKGERVGTVGSSVGLGREAWEGLGA